VAFEDLRITGEEKDASILELRQADETTRANLEMEKQVEGKSPPNPLFIDWFVSPRFALDLSPFRSQACELLSRHRRRGRRCSRQPTTPPSRSWGFWSRRPSKRARASTRVSGRQGAPWRVAYEP
jgi:hypothetical protein